MTDWSLSLATVYAGYPIKGFGLLEVETEMDIYALLHVEWRDGTIRVGVLWIPMPLEISW